MQIARTHILPASIEQLHAVNRVIEAAVMHWKLPERVKRLSLPSYLYDTTDFNSLLVLVAIEDGGVIGVAAVEETKAEDLPEGKTAMLLHGLFVHPDQQRRGIGRKLFEAASDTAQRMGADGLIVKAHPDAEGFFQELGMKKLFVKDPVRHYAYRYWKPIAPLS